MIPHKEEEESEESDSFSTSGDEASSRLRLPNKLERRVAVWLMGWWASEHALGIRPGSLAIKKVISQSVSSRGSYLFMLRDYTVDKMNCA